MRRVTHMNESRHTYQRCLDKVEEAIKCYKRAHENGDREGIALNKLGKLFADVMQGVVWQCVAVCCSVLQCVAVCCSVVQCIAVCCSVLQCVAV